MAETDADAIKARIASREPRIKTPGGGTAPQPYENNYDFPDQFGNYDRSKLSRYYGAPGKWHQTSNELILLVPIDSREPVQKRDVKVELGKSRIRAVHRDNVVVEGDFWKQIRPLESTWRIAEWTEEDDACYNDEERETFFLQSIEFTFVKATSGCAWEGLFWGDLGLA